MTGHAGGILSGRKMAKDIFGERRQTDPQGVIDDLIGQTTKQAKAIQELNQQLKKLEKEYENLKKQVKEK